MTQEPRCPECRTAVQPTWDWCMACGYDPEWLKPADWAPGLVAAALASTPTATPATTVAATPVTSDPAPRPQSARPARPARPGGITGTSDVGQARPQAMADLDWVPAEPRQRMSYLGAAALVAAIVIALGTLILVTVLVLNRPIGTTQANAEGMPAPASVSGPVAAAVG